MQKSEKRGSNVAFCVRCQLKTAIVLLSFVSKVCVINSSRMAVEASLLFTNCYSLQLSVNIMLSNTIKIIDFTLSFHTSLQTTTSKVAFRGFFTHKNMTNLLNEHVYLKVHE